MTDYASLSFGTKLETALKKIGEALERASEQLQSIKGDYLAFCYVCGVDIPIGSQSEVQEACQCNSFGNWVIAPSEEVALYIYDRIPPNFALTDLDKVVTQCCLFDPQEPIFDVYQI